MWRCCGWLRSLKWVVIEAYCSAIVLRSGRKGSVMGFATVSSSNLALFVQRSGRGGVVVGFAVGFAAVLHLFVQRSGCGGAVVGFASKGVPRALLSASPWNVHFMSLGWTLIVQIPRRCWTACRCRSAGGLAGGPGCRPGRC